MIDRTSVFRGGCWERGGGGTFFKKGWGGEGRGRNFYIKNKLKSEIFNGKKVYKQKYSLSLLRIKTSKF